MTETNTMTAAVLTAFGSPLELGEVPIPTAGTGEVLVDVLATTVLPYTADVLSGRRQYALEPPVVPGLGGVGRVRSLGPDSTSLRVGDLVLVDPTVRARDHALTPAITLQGWSSRGEDGARLAEYFHDGSFATVMRVPTENAHRLPDRAAEDPGRWSSLLTYAVPYGGLRAVGLAAGETALVSGATGNFGGAGVAVALAMGARRVVAPGRNRAALDVLAETFGPRVRTVGLTGDEQTDHAAMLEAADGRVDVVLDLLPPEAPATAARAAVMTVREYGRVCLMGGVGMLGGDDLALPYPWLMRNSITVRGQWMYEDGKAVPALIDLADAGLLDLSRESVTRFGLEDVEKAVAYAEEHPAAFDRTVLLPGG